MFVHRKVEYSIGKLSGDYIISIPSLPKKQQSIVRKLNSDDAAHQLAKETINNHLESIKEVKCSFKTTNDESLTR